MAKFYIVRVVSKCPNCNKEATHRVEAPGKISYGHFCKKHAEAHIEYLSKEE